MAKNPDGEPDGFKGRICFDGSSDPGLPFDPDELRPLSGLSSGPDEIWSGSHPGPDGEPDGVSRMAIRPG